MRQVLYTVGLAFMVTACAGGSNSVLKANTTAYRANNVNLVYTGSTANVPDKRVADVQRYMKKRFFGEKAVFSKGQKLTIEYGFIKFDEGNKTARFFLGPMSGGDAKMLIEATFIDVNGMEVAKIQSEGWINDGILGGGAGSAVKKAVGEIADYAEAQFAE